MKRHESLKVKRRKILDARRDTPIALYCGRYSWESSLIAKGGELHNVAEDMADLLNDYARLMGFGEEYEKVCEVLERLNEFYKKSLEASSTGKDWEQCGQPKPERVARAAEYEGKIFGRDWSKIDAMQQGK